MFDDDNLIDPSLTSALQALTLPLIYQTILNDDRCLGLRHHDLACARALGFDAPEPDLGLPDRPCLISPDIPTALQHAVEDALNQPESPFNPISPYPIGEGFNTYDRIPVLHFYDHKPEYFDQDDNRLHPPAVLHALKPYETPIRPARIKIRYAAKTRTGKYLYSDTLDLRFHHHAPDGVWEPLVSQETRHTAENLVVDLALVLFINNHGLEEVGKSACEHARTKLQMYRAYLAANPQNTILAGQAAEHAYLCLHGNLPTGSAALSYPDQIKEAQKADATDSTSPSSYANPTGHYHDQNHCDLHPYSRS